MKILILAFAAGLLFLLTACSYYTNGPDIANEINIATDVNGAEKTDGANEENVTTDTLD